MAKKVQEGRRVMSTLDQYVSSEVRKDLSHQLSHSFSNLGLL